MSPPKIEELSTSLLINSCLLHSVAHFHFCKRESCHKSTKPNINTNIKVLWILRNKLICEVGCTVLAHSILFTNSKTFSKAVQERERERERENKKYEYKKYNYSTSIK
jgi:hypothetical protein